MIPFLAKAMIPVATLLVTAVGVIQSIEYVKGKIKKRKKKKAPDDEFV